MVENVPADDAVRLIDHGIPTLKVTAMKGRHQFDRLCRADAAIKPGELNTVIGVRGQPQLLDGPPRQQCDIGTSVNKGQYV